MNKKQGNNRDNLIIKIFKDEFDKKYSDDECIFSLKGASPQIKKRFGDIRNNLQVLVIACLLSTKGISSKNILKILGGMEKSLQKNSEDFTIEALRSKDEAWYESVVRSLRDGIIPSDVPWILLKAVHDISEKYNGDVARLWMDSNKTGSECRSTEEIVRLLEEFTLSRDEEDVDLKDAARFKLQKTNFALIVLKYLVVYKIFKEPGPICLFPRDSFVRVLRRIGLVTKDAQGTEFMRQTLELDSEAYKLGTLASHLSRTCCKEKQPKCYDCRMKKLCKYNIEKKRRDD
jgi:hypothetical protein